MQVRVVYFEGCPHADEARRRLVEIVGDDSVEMRCVADADEAEREHLHGSPTILIDGVDPFIAPGVAPAASWSCRLYVTESGPAGVPSLAQLRSALSLAS